MFYTSYSHPPNFFFLSIAFLFVYDFYGMAIITAIMGFLRTWIHVPLPLVFSEYLSQAR